MYLQFSGVYFIDSNSDFSDPDPYFVPIRTQEKKSNPDPNKPGSGTMISTQNEKGAQEQKGTPKNNFNPFCGSQSRSTCCWSRQKRNGYVTLRLINNVLVVKKKDNFYKKLEQKNNNGKKIMKENMKENESNLRVNE